jgi:hypothetical protein
VKMNFVLLSNLCSMRFMHYEAMHYEKLYCTLLSHNYSFAPLIRHVSIKTRNKVERVRILDCFAALKAISDMAPAFKSISFHHNSDYPFSHLNKCLRLNELTALALHSCVFPSVNEWIHFLSEFSLLRQLYMANVMLETVRLPIGHAPASLPNLQELEIHSCMRALPYLTPPSMLYALHFGVDNVSDYPFFRTFMDKVVAKSPSHLQKLSLHTRMRLESCIGTFLYKYYPWLVDLIIPSQTYCITSTCDVC